MQESIVLANKSLEPNLIKFYNEDGGDLHSFVASKIYPECADTPLGKIKDKFKKQRQAAKSANFAIAYGGVGATIANNLSISIEEGDAVYDAYMKAFPKLADYFKQQRRLALDNGYILTDSISGRKIYIAGFKEFKALGREFTPQFWENYRQRKDKDEELKQKVRKYFKKQGEIGRNAQNYPIQGSSASITKLACIYIYRIIEQEGRYFEILFPNVIHDQVILEVPEHESERWANIVQDCMEKAGEKFCTVVKLKAEPEILTKWKK